MKGAKSEFACSISITTGFFWTHSHAGINMTYLLVLALVSLDPAGSPVARAHAHNDYEHKRPLMDALDAGFCSVEADIWLVDGQLLVAHNKSDLKPTRRLQALYLDPLRERSKANQGKIYPEGPPFHLLIDIKTDAKTTYVALTKVLENYSDILTTTQDGKSTIKAVTAVISGNCDREAIQKESVRYCGIDGRPTDLKSELPSHLIPWISASWSSQFKWNGKGSMTEAEKTKLKTFVATAHKSGRQVRFWATPETTAMWKELLAAEVDLINTDRLLELREFLLKEDPQPRDKR
jgi:hypothetical protein